MKRASSTARRERHAAVQLFPADWLSRTARMTRLVRSVYFDVCLFNLDENAPVSSEEMMLMLADLEGQGDAIINALVRTGRLVRDSEGMVYCEWAMEEAARAFALWEAKSRGGRSTGLKKAAGGAKKGGRTRVAGSKPALITNGKQPADVDCPSSPPARSAQDA